tara:strand:+ start:187504 stop:188343 length:840 start_codon:yes stop_codon:yes gene_type:complete
MSLRNVFLSGPAVSTELGMLGHRMLRLITLSLIVPLVVPATTPAYAQIGESVVTDPDQEFNDLLMLLDAFPELEPITRLQPLPADEVNEPTQEDGVDDEWMLTFLEMLDADAQQEKAQSVSELRSALVSLRRAESESAGEIKATLAAAAQNIGMLMLVVEQESETTDNDVRFAIAEAQRAMGMYHCSEAGKQATGTLADSLSLVSERLNHLATGARFMMSAAQTANYRIPETAKRTIASSVAMSKLFEPKEVSLSLIRTRARDIMIALKDLGTAIKRLR